MSLKAFHFVFVTVAILMCFGLSFREYRTQPSAGILLLGIGSTLAGLGLVLYAKALLKKLKGINLS